MELLPLFLLLRGFLPVSHFASVSPCFLLLTVCVFEEKKNDLWMERRDNDLRKRAGIAAEWNKNKKESQKLFITREEILDWNNKRKYAFDYLQRIFCRETNYI